MGYFKQNFASAPKHVDYKQIDWIVQNFVRNGKRALLVLHERHFHPKMMPPEHKHLQESWERLGVLYKTPRGMNDDWFWLHAAYTYPNCHVGTYDEMRDHHFHE